MSELELVREERDQARAILKDLLREYHIQESHCADRQWRQREDAFAIRQAEEEAEKIET